MGNLFIPETIKVGYQERKGTYTGRLAYVIYYDEKGKLRKEVSWQRWRSKDIDPDEFKNEPTEGFVLNKEVQRYNWSHFSSNRSYIRIYDPRGIEFEITPENLIGLLMESNCNKRMLEGKFVYAWHGTELVLLPCNSEAYKDAIEHTARQSKNISAKDLVEGCSYTLKNGNEVIYLGRYKWYTWDVYADRPHARSMKRKHIFWDGEDFNKFDSMTRLAYINSPDPVQEYAELVDKLMGDIRTQEVVSWKFLPAPPTEIETDGDYWGRIRNAVHLVVYGDMIYSYEIQNNRVRTRDTGYIDNFLLVHTHTMDIKTMKSETVRGDSRYTLDRYRPNNSKSEVIEKLKDAVEVYAVLESGKEYRLKRIDPWYLPGSK